MEMEIRIHDRYNGELVYSGSDPKSALEAYEKYNIGCESDWFPSIKMFNIDITVKELIFLAYMDKDKRKDI